jgi:hypothetical protein
VSQGAEFSADRGTRQPTRDIVAAWTSGGNETVG